MKDTQLATYLSKCVITYFARIRNATLRLDWVVTWFVIPNKIKNQI